MKAIEQGANPNQTKYFDVIFFIADSKEDFLLWEQALNSYVMQTKTVQQSYTFKEKLGQGSYGHVYLATLKNQNLLAIFAIEEEMAGVEGPPQISENV